MIPLFIFLLQMVW